MKGIKLIVICLFVFKISMAQDIKVHYLGHSAFVLQFDDITVVADYGRPNAWKQWGWDSPIYDIGELVPDIITYTHLHEDHYDSTRIPKGVEHVLKNGQNLDYKQLKIKAIPTSEDQFGDFNNTSYLYSYKGYNILHTGDIQAMIASIENDTIANYFKENYLDQMDVLIMPIEGKIQYIPQTEKFIQLLNPKNIIPSHYWSQEYLDEFVTFIESKGYSIKTIKNSRFELQEAIDKNSKIIILEKSLFF